MPNIVVGHATNFGAIDLFDRKTKWFELIPSDHYPKLFFHLADGRLTGGFSWFDVATGWDPVVSFLVTTKIKLDGRLVIGEKKRTVVERISLAFGVGRLIVVE